MACQQVSGGWKCDQNSINFNAPYDPTNPITSHMWKIDGAVVSTQPNFTQAVPVGIHSVEHSGYNACNALCIQSAQLEVVETLPPTTSQAASQSSSVFPLVFALLAFGTLGIVMTAKKK